MLLKAFDVRHVPAKVVPLAMVPLVLEVLAPVQAMSDMCSPFARPFDLLRLAIMMAVCVARPLTDTFVRLLRVVPLATPKSKAFVWPNAMAGVVLALKENEVMCFDVGASVIVPPVPMVIVLLAIARVAAPSKLAASVLLAVVARPKAQSLFRP